ncbi:hypothetical protein PAQ31011_02980 [Pandoraea aquatica]|uniref:Polyketide cyclase n=1 Tax=Pandoraea aquatica TaxID=2508290 RepID=A0A5E4VZ20_9BURK|nr:ester cyclase [Pandoraea aquatica]VVE17602.1 hypothetical protein PAQ31011_02980 [Pandoraea aquatica]
MSKDEQNKGVVRRWMKDFWGENVDISVVEQLAAPNMRIKYSLLKQGACGREGVKNFLAGWRTLFPDSKFVLDDLIAQGDYVITKWNGGGTHTGPAFDGFEMECCLPAATGRKLHFTGESVYRVIDGQIEEELGFDDAVSAMTQLGLFKATASKHDR